MIFKILEEKELEPSINMYIDYYNDVEGNKYTYSIVLKKFLQFMNLIDNRCYVLKEEDKILGVVLSYIKTYDDLKTYYLEEIVIEKGHQNQNLGCYLLSLVEEDIKKDDVKGIELLSINDEHHHRFYEKNGFKDVKNLTPKVKWFIS
ncbi:MAG: GNAT family N-acetyltransferase [Bacilli bacterium]|nr:GNAT family N-acetyltransferase [Bacilli bacterium]